MSIRQSPRTSETVTTTSLPFAEVEGGSAAHDFEQFLDVLMDQGVQFVPLGELLPEDIEAGQMVRGWIGGRVGWVAQRAVETT